MVADNIATYRTASIRFAKEIPGGVDAVWHLHVVWMNFCDVWTNKFEFLSAVAGKTPKKSPMRMFVDHLLEVENN